MNITYDVDITIIYLLLSLNEPKDEVCHFLSSGWGLPVSNSDPLTCSSCTGLGAVVELIRIISSSLLRPEPPPLLMCAQAIQPVGETVLLCVVPLPSHPPPMYTKFPSGSMSKAAPHACDPLWHTNSYHSRGSGRNGKKSSTIIISSSNTNVLMTPVVLRAAMQLYLAAGELDGARSSAYPTNTHSLQSATIGNNKRYDDWFGTDPRAALSRLHLQIAQRRFLFVKTVADTWPCVCMNDVL